MNDVKICELSCQAIGADQNDWHPLDDSSATNLLLSKFAFLLDLDGDPTQISGKIAFNHDDARRGLWKAAVTLKLSEDFYADHRRLIATLVAMTQI